MKEFMPDGEQFQKIVDIIETAKERAYHKVNEEWILMYQDIGKYISLQCENTTYEDAFVQKLADFFTKSIQNEKDSIAVDFIEWNSFMNFIK